MNGTDKAMKYILRFTPDTTDGIGKHSPDASRFFYFLNHGDRFGAHGQFRLIAETTPDRAKARRFDSHELAIDALKLSNDPNGWEVDEVAE